MNLEYICFPITNLCNMNCEYCYRLDSEINYINVDVCIACLNRLKELGCKTVNITGGEPLLHPNWKTIINKAHEIGLTVYLSTNGLLLDINDPILENIEMLIIPLDGSTQRIDAIYRGESHYDTVHKIINQYKQSEYGFKLKINTVMTRENIADLNNMIPLIDTGKVYWRIFYCKTKGKYNHVRKEILIDKSEYMSKILEIYSLLKHPSTFKYDNCISDGESHRNYTLISTNGDIYICKDDVNEKICSLIDNSIDEIKNHIIQL